MGNFLGVSAGVGGGLAAASQLPARAGQLPAGANRPGADQRPGVADRMRPQERPNWSQRTQGRGENWQQAVSNRDNYWNNRSASRQENLNSFRENRDQQWGNIENRQQNRQDWFENRQGDRQEWRVDNREDWQDHREDMWDYRYDRADEIWDDVEDYHDDLFDDQWWGGCSWGAGHYPPSYQNPSNPWWWWVPTAWSAVSSVLEEPEEPVYYDYGVTVIYEGDYVYQNGEVPVPADEYRQQAIELAAAVEDIPPPPAPPTVAAPAAETAVVANTATTSPTEEWMPLGVWALTQEEKGDATMFFQISINREGVISGGYQNVVTGESKPIAGSLDKKTQRVAWRIGDNQDTVIETGLFNLTKDVTNVSMHFGGQQTQTWLMVRLPAPEMPGAPAKVDTTLNRELPPAMGVQATNTNA